MTSNGFLKPYTAFSSMWFERSVIHLLDSLAKVIISFQKGYRMLACVVPMMSSTKEEPAIGFHGDLQRAAIISKAWTPTPIRKNDNFTCVFFSTSLE